VIVDIDLDIIVYKQNCTALKFKGRLQIITKKKLNNKLWGFS